MRETATESQPPPQALLERLKDYGQEHAFALWDDLSADERLNLVADIETLDLPRTDRIIRCSLHSPSVAAAAAAAFEPVPDSAVSTVDSRRPEDKDRWWKQGMKAVADGKLAVVLLSGGQGTRLGSSDPKGCLNIGLPSGKSLFQLHAERILSVQRLSAAAAAPPQIHLYVMTSPFTDDQTRRFFEAHRFFGLDSEQVTFFRQGTIPRVTREGRFVMETPWRVSKSPDGSGGVYAALRAAGILDDMAARGVKYVDCSGVDNALARVADPAFLGFFMEKGASAAAKVVRKAYPQEKVGVFVRRGKGGPLAVVEYTELDGAAASAIDQDTGRLRHRWGNACLHVFGLDFLHQVAAGLEKDAVYHLVGGNGNGNGNGKAFKLEQFAFDAFPYAAAGPALYEVAREEEFAPVKNANGGAGVFDTPDSARLLVLRLHSRWVVAAGGFLTHSVPLYATGVEVSPLCSYAGENLEPVCRGRTFHAPCEITF